MSEKFESPFNLKNKTILITGASSGIGRSTAIVCSQMGARLFITGRNKDKLQDTLNHLEGNEHNFFCADLSKTEELNNLIEHSPEIDGLVNNAGIAEIAPLNFVTQEKLNNVFEINTYAPIFLLEGLLKNKKIKNGASVVFTSSIAGNNVCPGMIETDFIHGIFTPKMLEEDAKKYPLKRYGKPEEVAYGIVYLKLRK